MDSKKHRKQAMFGSLWILFGFGTSQVLRLSSNLVLAHLLFPEAFGIMALVNIFVQGLQMFSDIGIGPSIIQNRKGNDPDFLNTAWTIQVIRGFFLWIACCLIAWPVSRFFAHNEHAQHELFWIMPVIAFSALISGFNSTSLFTLNRDLRMGAITILDIVPQIISLLAMGLLAWIHPSVWALVAGSTVYSLIRLAMSHWMYLPLHNRFQWDMEAVAEIRKFGKWIILGSIVSFLAANLDRLVLGKLLTLKELGVYSMALTFARVGTEVTARLSNTVLFPILSRSQHDPVTLVGQSLKARGLILLSGGSLACAFAISSPLFFHYCYDHRYANAGPISQWLCLTIWFTIVLNSMERVPMALGHSRALFVSNIFTTLGYAVAIPSYWSWGLPGFIVGLCSGLILAHLALLAWIPVRRQEMLIQTGIFSAIFFAYGGGMVYLMKVFSGQMDEHARIVFGLIASSIPCLIAGFFATHRLRSV